MGKTNNAIVKPRKKRRDKITTLFILSCTVLPVVNWLIFYVYCNFSAFFMGFTNKDGILSLDNFIRFFEEFYLATSEIRIALKNTLLTFLISFVSYPFQVLVSYFLYKKVPGHKFFRIAFFIPSLVFSVAISMVFTRMMDVNGFIAKFIGEQLNLGYTPELLADSRFANATVLAQLVWLSFPGNMIIWGGTFARIPEEVLESGRIDGANWWQEFTKIIVPMVWPTVALQMVLLFCGVFGASGNVFLLTKGKYGTITLNAWMYLQLLNNAGSRFATNVYNYMSAVGMIMTVIAIVISLVIRNITDKVFQEVEF